MQSIYALSLTPDGNDWLANSSHPRILHVFDYVCNLINERREVLSIVTKKIGNGPFNLVIEEDVLFSDHLNIQSSISIRANQFTLGNLSINTDNAKLWSPRPDWETLHAKRETILKQLMSLPITNCEPLLPTFLLSTLTTSIVTNDISSSLTAARKLAGLGQGLTPTGDDFILGAVLAAWIIHPPEIASVLMEEITNTAASLTTSLSGAWLRSAGRGEAGVLWHEFFNALIVSDPELVQKSVDEILAMGETSGADALAGFIGTLTVWLVKHNAAASNGYGSIENE